MSLDIKLRRQKKAKSSRIQDQEPRSSYVTGAAVEYGPVMPPRGYFPACLLVASSPFPFLYLCMMFIPYSLLSFFFTLVCVSLSPFLLFLQITQYSNVPLLNFLQPSPKNSSVTSRAGPVSARVWFSVAECVSLFCYWGHKLLAAEGVSESSPMSCMLRQDNNLQCIWCRGSYATKGNVRWILVTGRCYCCCCCCCFLVFVR